MITNNNLIWLLLGAVTAVLYLKSQQWSVNRLDPQKTGRSKRLIIGGAILRWMLIVAAMIISISHSYKALSIVILTFMVFRFLFLLKWQGWLRVKNPFIRQS